MRRDETRRDWWIEPGCFARAAPAAREGAPAAQRAAALLRRGAADISFVAPYTDALAGMGALGKGGHTPNESLELDSMGLAIKRAAILMYRLSGPAEQE